MYQEEESNYGDIKPEIKFGVVYKRELMFCSYIKYCAPQGEKFRYLGIETAIFAPFLR